MPVHGEVRGDGRIFWGYHRLAKNGEEWTTPQDFNKRGVKNE